MGAFDAEIDAAFVYGRALVARGPCEMTRQIVTDRIGERHVRHNAAIEKRPEPPFFKIVVLRVVFVGLGDCAYGTVLESRC